MPTSVQNHLPSNNGSGFSWFPETVNSGRDWQSDIGPVGACHEFAGRQVALCGAPLSGRIISHAVWLYFRFPLGLRMVEEMLAARGVIVSHETVRRWALKFG